MDLLGIYFIQASTKLTLLQDGWDCRGWIMEASDPKVLVKHPVKQVITIFDWGMLKSEGCFIGFTWYIYNHHGTYIITIKPIGVSSLLTQRPTVDHDRATFHSVALPVPKAWARRNCGKQSRGHRRWNRPVAVSVMHSRIGWGANLLDSSIPTQVEVRKRFPVFFVALVQSVKTLMLTNKQEIWPTKNWFQSIISQHSWSNEVFERGCWQQKLCMWLKPHESFWYRS